jgi:hypothetical protein
MNFIINKNATLPILKMQVVKDGRYDVKDFFETLEVSSIFFSMVDESNGIEKIVGAPASIVPLILPNGSKPEYYVYYKFTSKDTNKPGNYIGEFLIKNSEGNLIVPLRETLNITILDSI